jgi:hypothetical protein
MMRFSGLSLAFALAAMPVSPTPKATPVPRTKSHARAVDGRVVSVVPSRSFVLKTPSGEESTLLLTGATHLAGGQLKPGERVAVRYIVREGKKVATSIRVDAPQGASPTATATAVGSR